jgi:hypothetical protein
MKTPKLSPFSHGFGRGIKGKRTTKSSCIHPPTNPQENGLEISPRESPRKCSENHQKGKSRRTQTSLENHTESSIHTMKVHKRSRFHPIILPTHKISP